MSKQSSSQQSSLQNLLLGGAAAVILFLLVIVSQLTGIDLLGMLGIGDATPIVATTQPGGGPVITEVAEAGSPFVLYFTAPTGSSDYSTYVGGVDTAVAAAIDAATASVDIAAFELNSQPIATALLNAHQRGVQVRVVTDDEHGLDVELYWLYLDAADDPDEQEDIADVMETPPEDTLVDELYDAGIPIVDDDDQDLMHNKFIIIDGLDVWTGSMNLTVNGSYRNNNNFLRIRNRRMVENYQAEFNEMFEQELFGPRSPSNTPNPQVTINGVPVEVYFAPEDDVADEIIAEINAADSMIRFMAFSFTHDGIGDAMMARADDGVAVTGVFDALNSGGSRYGEIHRMWCDGGLRDLRWDGNNYILHHKVIIIDNDTVLIGSFNFSNSATQDNDENLLIIHDPALTARYIREFDARYSEGYVPDDITCN